MLRIELLLTTSASDLASSSPAARPAIGFFERWLTLWVPLCIVASVLLGQALPGFVRAVAAMDVAQVNLPVGVLIWVMIIPCC